MLRGIERFIVFPEVLLVEVTLVIYPGAIFWSNLCEESLTLLELGVTFVGVCWGTCQVLATDVGNT